MNPVAVTSGLKLNINEDSNDLDIDLVLSIAPQFRVSKADAAELVADFKYLISQFGTIAGKAGLGLSRAEVEEMAPAFRLALQ